MVFRLFQWFQVFSFITAIFCFKGLKHFKLTAYIPLLVCVIGFELVAANYFYFGWKSNYRVYDIYLPVSTPFLLNSIYNMLNYKGIYKKIYITVSVLFTAFLFYNAFFLQGLSVIDTYSYLGAESIIVIASFLAILRLFLDDDTSIMLNQHPYFWLSAVNVLFGIGVIFIMGISGYIKAHKIQIHGRNIYGYVTQVLNYVLYLGYAYAFYLCKKLTTRSS